MKKLKHITRSVCCYCVATCFAAAPILLVSCGEDDLDGTSIFLNEMTEQQQQAESVLNAIAKIEVDFIGRISHPEPGMAPKAYYKELREKFAAQAQELLDQLNA